MRWEAIGQGVFSPTAVSPGAGRLSLLARGPRGELLRKEWNGETWSDFESLGVPAASVDGSASLIPVEWPLAACSASQRVHLLARGPDGELLHMNSRGADWTSFECLGAPAAFSGTTAIPMGLAGPPAACGDGERIDAFAVGQGGALLHTFWDGEGWDEFESLGAPTQWFAEVERTVPLSAGLGACSCGNKRLAVFARGISGDLLLKFWDGKAWSAFTSLGSPQQPDAIYPAVTVPVPLTGPPAACSWGANRIDVFARGAHGELLHRSWDGKDWSSFDSLWMPQAGTGSDARSIPFTGMVSACTWGEARLDVFARAADGNIYHAWWDGSWDHPLAEKVGSSVRARQSQDSQG